MIKCWTALCACGPTFLLIPVAFSLIPDGADEHVSKENTVNKNSPNNIEENKSTWHWIWFNFWNLQLNIRTPFFENCDDVKNRNRSLHASQHRSDSMLGAKVTVLTEVRATVRKTLRCKITYISHSLLRRVTLPYLLILKLTCPTLSLRTTLLATSVNDPKCCQCQYWQERGNRLLVLITYIHWHHVCLITKTTAYIFTTLTKQCKNLPWYTPMMVSVDDLIYSLTAGKWYR